MTLRHHSVFAEYFPAGHVPYLMNVLTHPQMLALQRLCLESEDIYFDHNQLLTRAPSYDGGGWHCHRIGAGHDEGPADIDAYRLQPNSNLNICYPQGFAAAKAGLQRQQIQPSCTGAGGSLKPIRIHQGSFHLLLH